jgi:drug/metabolite transporter (DMT)-like permease
VRVGAVVTEFPPVVAPVVPSVVPSAARAHRVGLAAVLAANLFWSFGGVLGKSSRVSGVVLSFWRLWIAAAIMVVIAWATDRWPTRAELRRVAPVGVLFAANVCAFFTTLQYLSIAVTLIIGALTPVVALPIAVVLLGERLTAIKVGCAVVAVGGVVVAVLTAPASGAHVHNQAIGYVWAVVALLVWVAYLFVSKRARGHVETVRFMLLVTFTGAVTVSLLAVATRSALGGVHGAAWAWVALLAVGPGLAGHGLLAWATPRVDSSVSSLLIQAEPVGAAIAAWAILGERVSLAQGVSMVVVLAALGTLAYREAREGPIDVGEGIA